MVGCSTSSALARWDSFDNFQCQKNWNYKLMFPMWWELMSDKWEWEIYLFISVSVSFLKCWGIWRNDCWKVSLTLQIFLEMTQLKQRFTHTSYHKIGMLVSKRYIPWRWDYVSILVFIKMCILVTLEMNFLFLSSQLRTNNAGREQRDGNISPPHGLTGSGEHVFEVCRSQNLLPSKSPPVPHPPTALTNPKWLTRQDKGQEIYSNGMPENPF